MRAAWVFIFAACSLALLAGCTTQSAPASDVRVTGHATTPGAAHESGSERIVTPHDGVVATATLQSPNDTTMGTLTVRYFSGNFTFRLTNFTTSYSGRAMPALADTPESLGHCASYVMAFEDLPSGTTAPTTDKFILDPSDLGSNDPSNLQTLLIVAYPTGKLVDGCDIPILATAPIRWTMPDTHPDLMAKDRGPHAAAEGTETFRGGVPFTYLVHSGDVWSAIAKRFGITGDDLAFLNPFSRGVDSETAYADETLNLDKSHRGDSESRRFGTQ